MNNLFYNQAAEFLLIHVIAAAEGWLVLRRNWKVNYTRKINHFFVFFSPYLLALFFPYEQTLAAQVVIAAAGLLTLGIYLGPIRRRVALVRLMFAAFDRPEDRPHTLRWLFTQYLATYLVALPLWMLFQHLGHPEAIPLIILINAIGDGLAEPIGVRWGRHKYAVKALFTYHRTYTRSIEGSACVFFTAVAAVTCFYASFSTQQFYLALFTVPVTATLAEAKAPHTWDSPFIFLFTGLNLAGIYML